MRVFAATSGMLSAYAKLNEGCLVSFSGGKDSLVVLDMCVRVFKKVVAFHLYFVEGLAVIEERLEAARNRWGVEIRQYPHWVYANCLREGVYCPTHHTWKETPEVSQRDIYRLARKETGLSLVVTGCKKADFIGRRRMINQGKLDGFHPLADWNKYEVLAYLKWRDIPIPDEMGKDAGGVGLNTDSLLWLHDRHPADFEKLCEEFPYARAAVYRRDWFGIGRHFGGEEDSQEEAASGAGADAE